MAKHPTDRERLATGFKTGAKSGFVSGVAMVILCWFAAALLKGLITDFTDEWPEWFTGGDIVDFVLSGWWALIVMVVFTAGGAIIGVITRRRYELL